MIVLLANTVADKGPLISVSTWQEHIAYVTGKYTA